MSAQAEYVRVPLADSTLVPVSDGVTDEEALLAGDILSTGVQSAYLLDSSNIGCHEQGARRPGSRSYTEEAVFALVEHDRHVSAAG